MCSGELISQLCQNAKASPSLRPHHCPPRHCMGSQMCLTFEEGHWPHKIIQREANSSLKKMANVPVNSCARDPLADSKGVPCTQQGENS